ncbi:hypothetical protein M3Y97_00187500 [Aphelenchoides bicaudatus]|nr:hypothetical protein M3Y97_00187500 [Aphelenchoides bicaudatus]
MNIAPVGSPSTQVELTLSARKLADKDILSKSDPICFVYKVNPDGFGQMREIGRTETIQNCLNPNWSTKIKLDYYFETKQPLVFKLYDIDDNSMDLSNQDFLGECQCDLADIVAAPNGYLNMKLKAPTFSKGNLIVHAEELDQGQRQVMDFKIQGINLSKKSMFSKPDVFMEFYKFLPDGSRQLAFRSTICKNTVNPDWPPFEIPARALSGTDNDQDFLIEVYAYRSSGSFDAFSHKFIGSCKSTLNKLNGKAGLELPLWNEKKGKQMGNSAPFGILRFQKVILRREYSFLEYIQGGMQLEFAVSVDFTASNGPVHLPQSLHFFNGQIPNQYELAIRSVLEICEHYNHNKIFDAMGFGAKIPPNFEVKHLFPLNVNTFQRQVEGVGGVLEAYKQCLMSTQLYGPTNFEPSICEFAQKARTFPKDGSRYQILLIITDGVITDMQKTKAAIVNASDLPLSIIIVGVGHDSFDKMDELDSDDAFLQANGRVAKRDIVQFVPFREFMPQQSIEHLSTFDREQIKARLAKSVLEEVPDQVTSWAKLYGVPARTSQFISMPRESIDGSSSNRTLPQVPLQNQVYPNVYPEPPPSYNAAIITDQFVKQPPINPNYV